MRKEQLAIGRSHLFLYVESRNTTNPKALLMTELVQVHIGKEKWWKKVKKKIALTY
jgi:hypothetical protein